MEGKGQQGRDGKESSVSCEVGNRSEDESVRELALRRERAAKMRQERKKRESHWNALTSGELEDLQHYYLDHPEMINVWVRFSFRKTFSPHTK